jgi:2-polyprenyl-3-methyl-5-hydroxy-6-metoxy-1,4-benzoquinol methylase
VVSGTGPPQNTRGSEYAKRLVQLQTPRWKRVLSVQAPYRWNLRRLRLRFTLDVGCGIGRNLVNLDGHGVGIDHNAEAVAYAVSRGLTVFTPDEFDHSSFARQETFDSLLVAHVIEHLRRPAALDLVRRYLPYVRSDGAVVFVTPQERGFRSDLSHLEFVDLAALEAIAHELGLTVRRGYSFPLPRVFGKLFTYNEFVVVATKGRRC